jgi:hypothetical protein
MDSFAVLCRPMRNPHLSAISRERHQGWYRLVALGATIPASKILMLWTQEYGHVDGIDLLSKPADWRGRLPRTAAIVFNLNQHP